MEFHLVKRWQIPGYFMRQKSVTRNLVVILSSRLKKTQNCTRVIKWTKLLGCFFKNPATGKVKASPELLDALNVAGIKPEIGGKNPRDIVQK